MPYISANCIDGHLIDWSKAKYLTEERAHLLKKGLSINEDVLFAHNATVGPVAILRTKENLVILGTSLTAYRCNKEYILPEYLLAYMDSSIFRSQYEAGMQQSTRNQVPITTQRSYLFLVPPIPAQKKYSALFLQADKSKFDGYKSQFIEMFGNPLTNSQNRQLKPFIEVVTLHRGYDLPDSKRNQSGIIPIYGANGLVGYHDVSMAKDGVVTGRSGAIGEVYAVEGDYWPLNTALFSIDTHGNNVIYLQYLLKYFDIKRFGTGTGVPTLNRNDVHKEQIYDVPVPDQLKFTSLVKQADKSKYLN